MQISLSGCGQIIARITGVLIFLTLLAGPASAKRECDAFGFCRAYLSRRPVEPIPQETPVWCWAASLSMLFGYYDYPVDQASIVTRYFGLPVITTGPPWVLRSALNAEWSDSRGKRFRVSSRISDYYSGGPFQVNNQDIVDSLAAEKPVFFGNQTHAMILVEAHYVQSPPGPQVLAAWAIDPYPGFQFGFRRLQIEEMRAMFAAISELREIDVQQSLIEKVTNAASYVREIAPQSFASVFGKNLASATARWDDAVRNDVLPTLLAGTRVTVNGQDAYISYASPTQINFIVPPSTWRGDVNVVVTTPNGSINTAVVMKQRSPALFTASANTRLFAIAAPATDRRLFIGPAGAIGANSRPARRGEMIEMYATALGPTTPVAPDGRIIKPPFPTIDPARVKVHFGNVLVQPAFVGMTYAGVFQVNVQIPASAAGGEIPIRIQVDADLSPADVLIAIER